MSVLHELLAVETTLGETANRITKETTKILSTKHTLFSGLVKVHTIFNDEDQHLVQATEHKEVQSTVNEQLEFLNSNITAYWDVIYQKEEANQRANADIVINNVVLASNVPSIVLLGLEKKLISLQAVYNAIPTLDSAIAWEADPSNYKENVFRVKYPEERQHTVMTKKWVEVSKATKEHKAQIVSQETIDLIGKYVLTNFSGTISSYEKANKLEKLSTLIRAIKKARQRANDTEIKPELQIGNTLLGFINS